MLITLLRKGVLILFLIIGWSKPWAMAQEPSIQIDTVRGDLTRPSNINLAIDPEDIELMLEDEDLDRDPNTAALFSAVLPGFGQAYNGKYWKIPIIYSGFMGVGYFMNYNDYLFNVFRTALFAELDNNPATENPLPRFNQQALERRTDFFRRNRDLMIIISLAWYFLNVADAYIDAHLRAFELDEGLSLEMKPTWQMDPYMGNYFALAVQLKF